MKKYIPKDALVTEIERQKVQWRIYKSLEAKYRREMLDDISSFIDTIEVKEVDLEEEIRKEIDKYYDECEKKLYKMKDDDSNMSFLQLDSFAKHFFELGLKAQKGEE